MPDAVTRRTSYRFPYPVAAIWPALSDTARFNEASGYPRYIVQESPQPDGSVRFFAEGSIGRIKLAWEELPVEWVHHQWFWHGRSFSRGPMRFVSARATFESDDAGGCTCHYDVTAEPANLLGWLAVRTKFFRAVEENFIRLCSQVESWAAGVSQVPYQIEPYQPDDAANRRIADMVLRMENSDYGHGLGRQIVDWVLQAQEVDLIRIRPLALARDLQVPGRNMVEACLQAVRVGLLQQRWDLLCPRCRGAKLSVDGLDQLPTDAHCDACNIDYDRDFTRNVELTFTPAPALRPVYDGEFCLGGPINTPHVMAQVRLDPDSERSFSGALPPGPYRLRTLDPGAYAEFSHDGGALPAFEITDETVQCSSPQPRLTFRNRDFRHRIAVVERRDWAAEALTAEKVITYQAFRDICAAERLRPGDGAGVSQVALMFTDLKGSSDLYRRVGDAPAFGQVRSHFAYLTSHIRKRNGAIVKTMGDAVLAAFAEPSDALRAALEIQSGIAGFNQRQSADLSVKIGIHSGPCLAVTLNGRLDYFGQTVNLAARLQGQANGGEIVISDRVHDDPTVRPLADSQAGTRESALLRGFTTPEEYWRIAVAPD